MAGVVVVIGLMETRLRDDLRHSIVFSVKSIHLFAYFGMSLDLYDYLLLSCSNEYFYPVERDY